MLLLLLLLLSRDLAVSGDSYLMRPILSVFFLIHRGHIYGLIRNFFNCIPSKSLLSYWLLFLYWWLLLIYRYLGCCCWGK